MWEDVHLPQEAKNPDELEKLIEQFAVEKMQEYDGTVFLCIARSDREHRLTFCQAAQTLGYSARDGRAVCTALSAEALARSPRRNILFVDGTMQQYLSQYLDACPAGVRHVLLYSRRRGNGPSPHMSAFMDFWMERGVDIWDLHDVDKTGGGAEASHSRKRSSSACIMEWGRPILETSNRIIPVLCTAVPSREVSDALNQK